MVESILKTSSGIESSLRPGVLDPVLYDGSCLGGRVAHEEDDWPPLLLAQRHWQRSKYFGGLSAGDYCLELTNQGEVNLVVVWGAFWGRGRSTTSTSHLINP